MKRIKNYRLVNAAIDWVKQMQAYILLYGNTLESEYLALAQKMGIKHPEKIMVLVVSAMPRPEGNLVILKEMEKAGFPIGNNAAGITFGYGICLSKDRGGGKKTLIHEMAYVKQLEEMGIPVWVACYVRELRQFGYQDSPLEICARLTAETFSKNEESQS